MQCSCFARALAVVGPAVSEAIAGRRDVLGLAALVTTGALIGTSAVAIKVGGGPPLVSAGWRFGVASVFLLLFAKYLKLPMPQRRELAGAALIGVINFGLSNAFIYLALKKIQPGLAQIIATTNPLFTIFLARLHGLDRIRLTAMVGVALSLAGVAIMVGVQGNPPNLWDIALAALAALFSAEGFVLVRCLPGQHPVMTTAVAMPIGATLLFCLAAGSGDSLAPLASTAWILALVYNIIFGSIALFVLYFWVISVAGPVHAAYAFLIAPIFATGFGAAVTHETITSAFIGGATLVLAGVYVGVIRGGLDRTRGT
jgi:drug/metabolite transporter (DMT)-like permease